MAREFLLSASSSFGAVVFRHKVWFVSSIFLLFSALAVVLSMSAPEAGERLFGFFCHQRPERSLHLSGMTLPLCARCFGLYLGFGLAGILVPAFSRRFAIRILAATITFSALFWFLRFFFPVLDSNLVRLIFGLALGVGAVLLLKSFLKE